MKNLNDFYKGKNVLITGAGGFIGSHLVEALYVAGANVTALVHYNALGSIGNLRFLDMDIRNNIKIEAGDITDSFQMNHLSKGKEVIFHLAALIGIPYSYQAPSAYVNANINGTINLLEATKNNGVSKLLITSTSETYGTAIYEPIDELHPMQGQSPYSATKIGADKMGESYFRSFNLPVCTVRPFNTYGPRQSRRAVIPTIITQALYSKEIHLGSLSPVRDMLFVRDTCLGFMACGAEDKTSGETINLGTGTGFTIGEIANQIQEILGTKKPIIVEEARLRPEKSEVFKLICNAGKAKALLGWESTISLSKGLAEVAKWIQQEGVPDNLKNYSV